MKKVKEMVNYELKEARKAVEEAREAYYKSIREWNEIMCSLDYTGYLPDAIPEDVINEVLKKLPKGVSDEKLANEVSCYYWRARWLADSECLAASKDIDVVREVLRAKEEVLNKLETM